MNYEENHYILLSVSTTMHVIMFLLFGLEWEVESISNLMNVGDCITVVWLLSRISFVF